MPKKGGEFLYYVSDLQFLNNDFAP